MQYKLRNWKSQGIYDLVSGSVFYVPSSVLKVLCFKLWACHVFSRLAAERVKVQIRVTILRVACFYKFSPNFLQID